MQADVTTYHLEMSDPSELKPKRVATHGFRITQAKVPLPELNRFLYTSVGGDWYWIDRLQWSYQQWLDWLDRCEVETWVGFVEGTPAGYFELEAQAGANVEIVYFGILPRFVGEGLGGHLLTAATERAWQMGASRVWVRTSTLDHPAALGNYRARGFRIYQEETATRELPNALSGPWPGAHAPALAAAFCAPGGTAAGDSGVHR